MDKSRPRSVLLPALSTDPELVDSDFFWETHWKKFAAALVAIVIGILAFGAWSFFRANTASEAADLYAAADRPEAWQEIVSRYPDSLSAGNARLRIASALRAEGKSDQAVAELEGFLAAQPDHPLAGSAWLTIGEIRQVQGKKTDAIDAYRSASGRYQSSYAAPLALLAEARLVAAEGKAGESRALLESVGTSYPDGPAAMIAGAELAATAKASGPPRQAP